MKVLSAFAGKSEGEYMPTQNTVFFPRVRG